jgi:hypothetical protein
MSIFSGRFYPAASIRIVCAGVFAKAVQLKIFATANK